MPFMPKKIIKSFTYSIGVFRHVFKSFWSLFFFNNTVLPLNCTFIWTLKIIKSDFAAAEVTCEAIIHFYVVKKMRNDLT